MLRRALLSSRPRPRPPPGSQRLHHLASAAPASNRPSEPSAPHRHAFRRLSSGADPASYDDFLGSLSPARAKFVTILNDYKAANFERDTPSRFFSRIVKAADANRDGVISREEFRTLLENIGAGDRVSLEEEFEIFDEVGENRKDTGERVIDVQGMQERMSPLLRAMWKGP